MAAARIKIYKKNTIVKNGRQQEKEPELFYETWCEIGNLYGRELYEALDKRLDNTKSELEGQYHAIAEQEYQKALNEKLGG